MINQLKQNDVEGGSLEIIGLFVIHKIMFPATIYHPVLAEAVLAACFWHRSLVRLAHTMGNLDQAAQHFEDALTFCRNAGYRTELAWTCCDYAEEGQPDPAHQKNHLR